MELRVGNPGGLGNGQDRLTESVFINKGNRVVVLGAVGYGKGVDPSSTPEDAKIELTLAALAAGDDLCSKPDED